ncbi:dTMP kinase [Pseudomonas sp. NPDC086278]|uniref:dTMP kinase n=1 Tax=Pseudomonas sp. NPDC086278 TaxID=3390646 RepID=UPI003D01E55E
MGKGCMIVCDGNNGAGKTTVIREIEKQLLAAGKKVLVTREPGGTPIGEKIREVVLSPETPELCPTTELMLFAAARAQHLKEKICPAIEAGTIVVCDRFTPATIAFQHYGRGIPLDLVRTINDLALDGFSPDLNIILDVDPVIGMARVTSRGEGLDRMEQEKLDFLVRARDGFLVQAQESPENFTVVDSSQPLEDVIAQVSLAVQALLNRIG